VVSLVLNGRADRYGISKKTQEKVRAAIRQAGYTPNLAIRNLFLGKPSEAVNAALRRMDSDTLLGTLGPILAERGYRIASISEPIPAPDDFVVMPDGRSQITERETSAPPAMSLPNPPAVSMSNPPAPVPEPVPAPQPVPEQPRVEAPQPSPQPAGPPAEPEATPAPQPLQTMEPQMNAPASLENYAGQADEHTLPEPAPEPPPSPTPVPEPVQEPPPAPESVPEPMPEPEPAPEPAPEPESPAPPTESSPRDPELNSGTA